MKAAAKIIKEEFREMKFSKDFYPSIDEITSSEKGEKWVQNQLNVHEIVGSIKFETVSVLSKQRGQEVLLHRSCLVSAWILIKSPDANS